MRSRNTLYAAVAYLALAIAITYPLIGQLSTHIAGLSKNDSLEFVWSIWWFKHSLLDLHNSPINISVLNYPNGLQFPLLPSMSQSFLLPLPLAALISPVVAFNVIYLLSFPLCALAGYWLCYDLTHDRRAAFLGGLVWGFFPSKSAHAMAGHLFQMVVFMLPIATLFLLRALRAPSRRNAILAGVMLALAATIHPVNVAYCLIPMVIVVVAFALWDAYRPTLPSPSPKALWITMILIGVTGGLLSLPIFLPTFLSHDLGFLVERGLVGFSLDLYSFILPSPFHPWLIDTPVGDFIHKIDFTEFEHVAYLGLVALTLGIIGVRWNWRASRIWLVLAILTMVLSLGPELQIGRQVASLTVETDKVPILLPYAWINQLPFFQWSRTPGRLNETTMLALMVLAAYGATTVFGWIKNRQVATALWLAACVVMPIEYLERWPLPTSVIPSSPALFQMANDQSFTAVMNFPVADNSVNLLDLVEQTQHQHPIIGGRVYRDQPGGLWVQDFLNTMLRTPLTGNDIATLPTVEQRTAGLAYYGVGRIVYQPTGDHDGSGKTQLESLLGAPQSADNVLSVYVVPPPATPPAPYFIFGPNWYAPEEWQAPTRWFTGIGFAYLFSPSDTTSALRFTAIPGQDMRRLLIKVNGTEVAHFVVGDWADYETPAINFKAGSNIIEFFDQDGSWHYVGDPRCQHGSAIAGPFPYDVPCDASSNEDRNLSLAIQNVQLVPATPPTVQAAFGGKLNLLQATGPTQAKAGETVTYHFEWQAPDVPDQDYTLFVHILDAQGKLVAGDDSPPVHGNYATTRWLPNQTVAYNVALPLPADQAAGTYTVEIGWYVWPSLERLTLDDGSSTIKIGTLQVQ